MMAHARFTGQVAFFLIIMLSKLYFLEANSSLNQNQQQAGYELKFQVEPDNSTISKLEKQQQIFKCQVRLAPVIYELGVSGSTKRIAKTFKNSEQLKLKKLQQIMIKNVSLQIDWFRGEQNLTQLNSMVSNELEFVSIINVELRNNNNNNNNNSGLTTNSGNNDKKVNANNNKSTRIEIKNTLNEAQLKLTSRLKISHLKLSDSGQYKCIARAQFVQATVDSNSASQQQQILNSPHSASEESTGSDKTTTTTTTTLLLQQQQLESNKVTLWVSETNGRVTNDVLKTILNEQLKQAPANKLANHKRWYDSWWPSQAANNMKSSQDSLENGNGNGNLAPASAIDATGASQMEDAEGGGGNINQISRIFNDTQHAALNVQLGKIMPPTNRHYIQHHNHLKHQHQYHHHERHHRHPHEGHQTSSPTSTKEPSGDTVGFVGILNNRNKVGTTDDNGTNKLDNNPLLVGGDRPRNIEAPPSSSSLNQQLNQFNQTSQEGGRGGSFKATTFEDDEDLFKLEQGILLQRGSKSITRGQSSLTSQSASGQEMLAAGTIDDTGGASITELLANDDENESQESIESGSQSSTATTRIRGVLLSSSVVVDGSRDDGSSQDEMNQWPTQAANPDWLPLAPVKKYTTNDHHDNKNESSSLSSLWWFSPSALLPKLGISSGKGNNDYKEPIDSGHYNGALAQNVGQPMDDDSLYPPDSSNQQQRERQKQKTRKGFVNLFSDYQPSNHDQFTKPVPPTSSQQGYILPTLDYHYNKNSNDNSNHHLEQQTNTHHYHNNNYYYQHHHQHHPHAPDIGCYTNFGEKYSGNQSVSGDGRNCLNWIELLNNLKNSLSNESYYNNPLARGSGGANIFNFYLSATRRLRRHDQNYCRNPNVDMRGPWCFVVYDSQLDGNIVENDDDFISLLLPIAITQPTSMLIDVTSVDSAPSSSTTTSSTNIPPTDDNNNMQTNNSKSDASSTTVELIMVRYIQRNCSIGPCSEYLWLYIVAPPLGLVTILSIILIFLVRYIQKRNKLIDWDSPRSEDRGQPNQTSKNPLNRLFVFSRGCSGKFGTEKFTTTIYNEDNSKGNYLDNEDIFEIVDDIDWTEGCSTNHLGAYNHKHTLIGQQQQLITPDHHQLQHQFQEPEVERPMIINKRMINNKSTTIYDNFEVQGSSQNGTHKASTHVGPIFATLRCHMQGGGGGSGSQFAAGNFQKGSHVVSCKNLPKKSPSTLIELSNHSTLKDDSSSSSCSCVRSFQPNLVKFD